MVKRRALGLEPIKPTAEVLAEERGFADPTDLWGLDGTIKPR